ncbi:hypothetical protein C6P46_001505 [Rhodotorula mucilaginosa]|uniref:Uncharacterized protein n=1 Tax=Rhodotorula mucilaginosa TaxID=5537 RepID=A0A9P6W6Z4_RHOMI|nr:hypothetical protein C6P46_001505 [Rhodotorula mucilaginosa]
MTVIAIDGAKARAATLSEYDDDDKYSDDDVKYKSTSRRSRRSGGAPYPEDDAPFTDSGYAASSDKYGASRPPAGRVDPSSQTSYGSPANQPSRQDPYASSAYGAPSSYAPSQSGFSAPSSQPHAPLPTQHAIGYSQPPTVYAPPPVGTPQGGAPGYNASSMPPQPPNPAAQTPSQSTPYGAYQQAQQNYGLQQTAQPQLQSQPYPNLGYSSSPMLQSYPTSPAPPSMPPSAPTYSVQSPQVSTWQQSPPPDFARTASQQSLASSPGPIAGQWANQVASPPPPTPSAAPSSYGQPTLTSAQYPGPPTLAGAHYSPGITLNPVSPNPPGSSASPFPPFPGPPPPPAFLAQSPYGPPGTPQPASWNSAQGSPPQTRSDALQQPPSGATGHWEQDPGSKQWTWVMQLPQGPSPPQPPPPPPPPPAQPASAPPPPPIPQHWVPDAGGNWTLQPDAPPAQYPFPPTPPTLPNQMQSAMMPNGQAYPPVQVTDPNGQRSYAQPMQVSQSAGSAPYSASAPPYPPPPASVYSTAPHPSAYGTTPPVDTRAGAPRPSAPSQYSSPTSTYRAPSRASSRAPPSSRYEDDDFSDRSGRGRRDSAVGMGRSGRRSRDEEARGRGTGRDDNRRRDRSASTGRDSSRSRSASRGRGSGDGRGVEYRSLSKGRNSRRNSASEAEVRRALAAQIAREEEEILAERYAKAREQRQQRQERAAVPPAAPTRPPAMRRMSTGDRFRQNHIVEDVAPPAPVRPMLPPSKASRIAAWSANIKADGDDFSHDDDTVSRDSRDSGPLRSALKGGRARAGANPGDLDDVVEAFEPLTTNRAAKFYANWLPARGR